MLGLVGATYSSPILCNQLPSMPVRVSVTATSYQQQAQDIV